MKRIRVISDGTIEGTKILDPETGESFPLPVFRIEWRHEVGHLPEIVLFFHAHSMDIDAIGHTE